MVGKAVRRAVMLFAIPAATALALAGCSGTVSESPVLASNSSAEKPAGRQMIGKPYRAGGRWFTPKEDPDFNETGVASWYGAELHGNRTANGERFDANALTAAHPTLPLPSYVRVTNMTNGKAAVLRLNDRGPFTRNRLLDVSRAAAEKLDFRRAGRAKVRVEYLGPAPVDGGDAETLVAEANYGISGGSGGGGSGGAQGRSLRDIVPFGRGRDKEVEGDVEVRLASVAGEPSRHGGALPGVRLPEVYTAAPAPADPTLTTTQPGAPATVELASLSAAERAQAYQDQDTASLDALITMSGGESEPVEATAPVAVVAPAYNEIPEPSAEPLAEAPKAQQGAATPLAIAPVEADGSRIGGAHDLFAAIDAGPGGSGARGDAGN